MLESEIFQYGMAHNGIQQPRPSHSNVKRKVSEISEDDDGWLKAWQIKFKYGKSNNLSVWLIDRLTRSEGGKWINMEEGRFELEWIDTANAWYAERQRRSKCSQSTHLLYKAIQAAFPNITEESSEKNKHIFVRRSFKLPDDLCDEVRQIVIGTGTKRTVQSHVIQIPAWAASSSGRQLPAPQPQQQQQQQQQQQGDDMLPSVREITTSAHCSLPTPKPQYKVPDTLMRDFMSVVSSTSLIPAVPGHDEPVTKLMSAWKMDVPTESTSPSSKSPIPTSPTDTCDVMSDPAPRAAQDHGVKSEDTCRITDIRQVHLGSPLSPRLLKDRYQQSNSHEATFEQICEYAKQQLEIIHKWANEMDAFKKLSCNDQKVLLTSSAPEILVFSICCFSVLNKCGPDNLLLDKDLVISRTNRQFETAIRTIVGFIIDTIVDPLKAMTSDRYELSRLRRIILFNATNKKTHQDLQDPEQVRNLRRTEHILLQKHTNSTSGRLGDMLLLLPPLTIAGTLFVEHLHLEKLVGDTFDNLVAAELLLAMGSG